MNALARFRLITFDVVDTLLHFRIAPGKQYGEFGAMFGVYSDDNQLVASFKNNWQHMNRAHPNFGLKTKIGYREWWRKVITGTFRDSSVETSDEKLARLCDFLLEEYKTSSCWTHSYGAVDFLKYLKLNKQMDTKEDGPPFKLGVISNFDPRLDVLLRNMKINQYFDFVINSYDAGCEKPQMEIFHKAMKAAEIPNLQPEQCLHIGHTVVTDYFGAKKCADVLSLKPNGYVHPWPRRVLHEAKCFFMSSARHFLISNATHVPNQHVEAIWRKNGELVAVAKAEGFYALIIHEKSPEALRRKYGPGIEDNHVFNSLFDLHKKISNGHMQW